MPRRGEISFQTTPESMPGKLIAGMISGMSGFAGDVGRERFVALMIPAHAEVQRQALHRERVLKVEGLRLQVELGEAVAEQVGVAATGEARASASGRIRARDIREASHGVAAGVADRVARAPSASGNRP